MAYYMEYPIYVWTTQPVPEAENYTDATYNTTSCVSNLTLTENTTARMYDVNVLVSVTVTASSTTGTVYPFTYTFGGGSSSDGEL
jgi:hypothetical protein